MGDVRRHAREIVGIALSRPEGAVRIFSIQALFVAGNCLRERGEQEVCLRLLEGVERDLGWKVSYRGEGLRGVWGWK